MLFNADKFEAAVRTKPVLLPSDEFMCPPETTALPIELSVSLLHSSVPAHPDRDDKCITMTGYLAPLPGTPLATGFTALIHTCQCVLPLTAASDLSLIGQCPWRHAHPRARYPPQTTTDAGGHPRRTEEGADLSIALEIHPGRSSEGFSIP